MDPSVQAMIYTTQKQQQLQALLSSLKGGLNKGTSALPRIRLFRQVCRAIWEWYHQRFLHHQECLQRIL